MVRTFASPTVGLEALAAGAGAIGGEKDCFEQELAGPLGALKPHQVDTLQLHLFLRPAVASHVVIHRQMLMQRTLCLALAEHHGGIRVNQRAGSQGRRRKSDLPDGEAVSGADAYRISPLRQQVL